MIIMTPEHKIKGCKATAQDPAGTGNRLPVHAMPRARFAALRFENWYQYLRRDLSKPLSPLDEDLSEADFAARDKFQICVLEAAGLGPVARELLDRVNPTGSWARQPAEPVWEAVAGNDPL